MSKISYTVYIVDDEQTIREGVTMALEDLYRIKDFADAESAIAALEKEPPDLVLLDVGLPGMDGIEALQRILDMDNTIPVILNTAYSSYRENYLTWSADAYITKSSDTTELLVKVKELLDAKLVEN